MDVSRFVQEMQEMKHALHIWPGILPDCTTKTADSAVADRGLPLQPSVDFGPRD
jgi:hypothetical protein